ncbi:MAG: N-acetyltransferase family protein [Mycobacteriales bacterium]|nr:GNAT family N-acetyltransferase [Frankia sp.]
MRRVPVLVRAATRADLPALLDLWSQMRDTGPRRAGRGLTADTNAAVGQRYADAMSRADCRLLVATAHDTIAGMALLTEATSSALFDIPAVQVTHLCVGDGFRRRGIGKALLEAAVAYAEELGVEQIAVGVYPGHRDTNRFFARLGFAPVLVRRIAPVAVVRRQLAPAEGRAASLRRELIKPRRMPLPVTQRRRVAAAAAEPRVR